MMLSGNSRRKNHLRFRDELLNPSYHVQGCVPWADVPHEFCWLSRTPFMLRLVAINKKEIYQHRFSRLRRRRAWFLHQDTIRIRDDVETIRVHLDCFIINGQTFSPSFLIESILVSVQLQTIFLISSF